MLGRVVAALSDGALPCCGHLYGLWHGMMRAGAPKPALTDVTCHVRLDSRVAVLGRNGAGGFYGRPSTHVCNLDAQPARLQHQACFGLPSTMPYPAYMHAHLKPTPHPHRNNSQTYTPPTGKSTLIKILTAELKSEAGQVQRHPNLRVAYVAQHAFHHVDEHLDISPARYILRRYCGGARALLPLLLLLLRTTAGGGGIFLSCGLWLWGAAGVPLCAVTVAVRASAGNFFFVCVWGGVVVTPYLHISHPHSLNHHTPNPQARTRRRRARCTARWRAMSGRRRGTRSG